MDKMFEQILIITTNAHEECEYSSFENYSNPYILKKALDEIDFLLKRKFVQDYLVSKKYSIIKTYIDEGFMIEYRYYDQDETNCVGLYNFTSGVFGTDEFFRLETLNAIIND